MNYGEELAQLIADRSAEFEQIGHSWKILWNLMKFWFHDSRAEFFENSMDLAALVQEGAERIVSQFQVLCINLIIK